jgi:hypothetical protein
MFWKNRRNQVGYISSSSCRFAWVKESGNCVGKIRLSSPYYPRTVFKDNAVRCFDEKSEEQDSTLNKKESKDNKDKMVNFPAKNPDCAYVAKVNVASPSAMQKPVFIRVRTLPGN